EVRILLGAPPSCCSNESPSPRARRTVSFRRACGRAAWTANKKKPRARQGFQCSVRESEVTGWGGCRRNEATVPKALPRGNHEFPACKKVTPVMRHSAHHRGQWDR